MEEMKMQAAATEEVRSGTETEQKTEQKNEGAAHVELSRPVKYNDREYSALDFDFEALTGADGANIEQEIQARGRAVLLPTLDSEYLMGMAARACKQQVGTDFFMSMPLRDNLRVRGLVRNFLRDSE